MAEVAFHEPLTGHKEFDDLIARFAEETDAAKAEEIRFFTDNLNVLLKRLSPDASEEKRAAVEEYFWLIEEYKVSVFAQELKTPVRVSKKRLEGKLKEIERII